MIGQDAPWLRDGGRPARRTLARRRREGDRPAGRLHRRRRRSGLGTSMWRSTASPPEDQTARVRVKSRGAVAPWLFTSDDPSYKATIPSPPAAPGTRAEPSGARVPPDPSANSSTIPLAPVCAYRNRPSLEIAESTVPGSVERVTEQREGAARFLADMAERPTTGVAREEVPAEAGDPAGRGLPRAHRAEFGDRAVGVQTKLANALLPASATRR